MTRHFLALIALISGLAALQSPAHASLVQALNNDIGVSADAGQTASKDACPCKLDATRPRARRNEKHRKPLLDELPSALRLPVLMGVERAYE